MPQDIPHENGQNDDAHSVATLPIETQPQDAPYHSADDSGGGAIEGTEGPAVLNYMHGTGEDIDLYDGNSVFVASMIYVPRFNIDESDPPPSQKVSDFPDTDLVLRTVDGVRVRVALWELHHIDNNMNKDVNPTSTLPPPGNSSHYRALEDPEVGEDNDGGIVPVLPLQMSNHRHRMHTLLLRT